MGETIGNGLYKVQSFTEKPEREFAKIFCRSGEFYWNTGLFLSNVKYLRECFCKILPLYSVITINSIRNSVWRLRMHT